MGQGIREGLGLRVWHCVKACPPQVHPKTLKAAKPEKINGKLGSTGVTRDNCQCSGPSQISYIVLV